MSRLKSSRVSGFSSKDRRIPPNSGRLDTLLGFFFFGGGGGGGGGRATEPRSAREYSHRI